MNIQEQIKEYITSQPEPKRSEMQALHQLILQVLPACKLKNMEQTNKQPEKKFDAIKVMREIRDKISLEIMNMTYEQERAYLDEILAKGKLQQK